MSYYVLNTDADGNTDHRVKGTSPAKALRELVAMAGWELAEQDGRYGTLTDGRRVRAYTEAYGRAYYGRGDSEHLAKLGLR